MEQFRPRLTDTLNWDRGHITWNRPWPGLSDTYA
jgi:hypothetical protein